MTTEKIRIGIVTVSDRVSRGEYRDRGGPAVRSWIQSALRNPVLAVERRVPDDSKSIQDVLRELCDRQGCCLVLTTGGTGPAPRDVTPESTMAVCEKVLPGLGERMRAVSTSRVPTAILSRQAAGIRGSTLIVNLPGSPGAIEECLRAVFPAVPHCIALLGGPDLKTEEAFIQAYGAESQHPPSEAPPESR